jgi:tetratricopeptide (TPR) repeat protein
MAQAPSLAGKWEFHPEKSAAKPGPVPYKSATVTFSDAAGTQMTIEGVDAEGKPFKATMTGVADGKPHPVTGMVDYDTSTLIRASDTTASFNYTKRKSTVMLGNRVLSRDGGVLTFREQTFNTNGKPTGTETIVFAKPGYDFASAERAAAAPRAPAGTLVSPLSPAESAAAASLEKGDDDAAIAAFTKIIDAKQATPMLYYDYVGRGIALAKKGENEKAVADFDASIKLKPDNADALFRRGGTKLQLKQYQPAIDDFSAAIKADASNAMAYRLRGFAYNTLGNDKAAGADYDKACMLDKNLCQN